MLVSRRFVDAVGMLRGDYFLSGEEVKWCERGLRRAMRIGFAPRARVLNNKRSTTGSGGAINLGDVPKDMLPEIAPILQGRYQRYSRYLHIAQPDRGCWCFIPQKLMRIF